MSGLVTRKALKRNAYRILNTVRFWRLCVTKIESLFSKYPHSLSNWEYLDLSGPTKYALIVWRRKHSWLPKCCVLVFMYLLHDGQCPRGRLSLYRILVGKPEGNRPIERPKTYWDGHRKIDCILIKWKGLCWINLAQDRGKWRAVVNIPLTFWHPNFTFKF